MVEEGGQTTTESTETVETPTMFGEDGGFTENWTHTLTDTALHDNATLKSAKTVEALAAMTVSAQKMVGSDKIAVPNEASSEMEWNEFHKAGGRPETAADYGFKRPEDFPEELYHQEYVDGVQEILHKHGGSMKLAAALFEHEINFKAKLVQTKQQDTELAATELKDKLYADWGNAFEQKKHLGNKAIEEGVAGNEEFKARLTEKFGNDPDFIRFTANLGGKFAESGAIKIEQIPTPGDIQEQIDTITASGAYSPDYAKKGFTRAQHDSAVQKAMQLRTANMKNVKTG